MQHTFLIDNCVLVLERKKIKFKKKRKKFLTNPILDDLPDIVRSQVNLMGLHCMTYIKHLKDRK